MSQFFQKAKRLLINSFLPVIIGLFLVVAVIYAVWQEPKAVPPGDNVPAPLNVGPDAQAKEGMLWLAYNSAVTTGLIVEYGNVGIGTTDPIAPLDISVDGTNPSLTSIGSTSVLFKSSEGVGLTLLSGDAHSSKIRFTKSAGAGDGLITYFPDIEDMTIAAGGSGMIYLNGSAGEKKVGILEQSPASTLTVRGGMVIGSDLSYTQGVTAPDGTLIVEGNVGIGTTDPQSTLQVVGNYIQFPVLVGAPVSPPSADCDENTEWGRVVVVTENGGIVQLYVCGGQGWRLI